MLLLRAGRVQFGLRDRNSNKQRERRTLNYRKTKKEKEKNTAITVSRPISLSVSAPPHASNLPHMFRVGSGATGSRNWAAGGGGGNGCVGRASWRRRVVFLHPLAVGHHLFRHAHNPPKDAVKVGQQKKVRPTPMTKEKFNIFLWE